MTQLIEESVVEEPQEPWSCSGCHSTFEDVEPRAVLSRGPICELCYAVCPDCDREFNLQSGYTHADIGEGAVCNRCTRDNYFSCNDCDEWVSEGQDWGRDLYGSRICDGCASNYGDCDECGQSVDFRDYHDCEPPSDNNVLSYSEKPEPVFHHMSDELAHAEVITQETPNVIRKYRKIAYLGIEAEVECGDRSVGTFNKGAGIFDDMDYVYLKHDSSIRYGFEIVSHPMTLDWAMTNFKFDAFSQLESLGFSAWDETTVGIHIHVSRDGFTGDLHQMRFLHFILRNSEFLQWLVGRGDGQYSRFDRRHLRRMTKARLHGRDHSDRYMAVNLNNFATIEVRMFQASLKPERIKMNLQLIDAIVMYTESLSMSDILHCQGFSHESFMSWVRRNTNRYPNLTEYIDQWSDALNQEQLNGYKARIGE